ncbi:MAG: hypothetical protein WKF78_14735 [Candidatus Limnocylindrales bacterium]
MATHTPRVPYRETIRGTTKVHGRYKKQTGGHGMFGDVWLELEPNPGGGIEFAERVVGGAVPKGFFAGVEKGIREAASEGALAGYPLSDIKATLYDGSFHPVDLERAVVQDRRLDRAQGRRPPGQAGASRADHERARSGSPSRYMGEVDPGPERRGVAGSWAWTATAPCRSSRRRCPRPSCSATRRNCAPWPTGAARSRPPPDHYDDVPGHVAEKVIEAHRKELEAAGGHGGGH